jgi:hypothetical protein
MLCQYIRYEKFMAMRALLFLPLFLPSISALAKEMIVVVHTRDILVTEYVCRERSASGSGDAVRSVVTRHGGFNWHVVGGVPPYTVINDEEGGGMMCVTVIDAIGNVASGCGTIQIFTERLTVSCVPLKEEAKPVPLDSLDLIKRPIAARPSPPVERPRVHHEKPPTDKNGRYRNDYRVPVRSDGDSGGHSTGTVMRETGGGNSGNGGGSDAPQPVYNTGVDRGSGTGGAGRSSSGGTTYGR